MVFSSCVFLFIFLPITIFGYFLINPRFKNLFLLIMSLLFYAYGEPETVFIMVALSFLNYLYALLIFFFRKYKFDKIVLLIAVFSNLGVLFYYKYYDFAIINVNSVFNTTYELKQIALPIGISFFTFQGMSYVLDIYMKKAEIQKNPLNVLLYIALFPQLIAGPIVRYADINNQITSRKENIDKFAYGIKRFTTGLAKKVLLSNNLAIMADAIFDSELTSVSVISLWLGAIFYMLQIYFDFSGYSDMAIGLGKCFGFDFLENFNYPYISKSITDFWRRWHISLSSWFRDYIYIPLGGSRKGNTYIHLFVVFLITGIWHGASWNFVLWGMWHYLFRLIEKIIQGKRSNKKKEIKVVGHVYTLLVVLLGWIIFRCPNLSTTCLYYKGMFGLNGNPFFDNHAAFFLKENVILMVIGIVCSMPLHSVAAKHSTPLCKKIVDMFEPFYLVALLLASFSYIVNNTYNPFIYFNF